MKYLGRIFILLFLIIGFLLAWASGASGFEIVEVQTRGDGGAYDECVKISGAGSLLNFVLQSRSATSDKWVSRSGDGLPGVSIGAGEIAILASKNYSGSDEIWRHTARWGFSDDGGGVRLLDNDGVVVAEKYWGSLGAPNDVEDEPLNDAEPPPAEPEPEPEPDPEPELVETQDFASPPSDPEPSSLNAPDSPPDNPTEPSLETPSDSPTAPSESLEPSLPSPSASPEPPDYSAMTITISEFMPDPAGSDDSEWIEIKNIGEDSIDIGGWKIDDEEGGSKPFTIPENTIISPRGFIVFYKSQTKLALNNDEDSVRLINPLDEVIQEISYSDNTVGITYAIKEGEWSWTTSPTPAGDNIISAPQEKTTIKNSSSNSYGSAPSQITELKDVRELPKDTNVTVIGIVSAPPGILGSQIFYIAGSGIQIYMYKKDFPDLVLGDEIQLAGTLSEVAGETRIKIKNREDITLLEHKDEPVPHPVSIGDIGEELEGSLVKVSGEVIEKISNGFYLSDEEGNEVKIYLKTYTDLSSDLVNLGEKIEAQGIVSQTQTGYRLLPRYESDIIMKEQNNVGAENFQSEKNMLKSKYKYLAVLGLGLLSLMLIKIYKKKKNLKS